MKLLQPISHLLLAIGSLAKDAAALEAPTELWRQSIGGNRLIRDLYYSDSKARLYVFAAEPASVLTYTTNGELENDFVIPALNVSEATYGVWQMTARETDEGLDFFVLFVTDGCTTIDTERVCTDRIVLYVPNADPAQPGQIRWEQVNTPNILTPYGRSAISNDGTLVVQHGINGPLSARNGTIIAFRSDSGEVAWSRDFGVAAGGTFSNDDAAIFFGIRGGDTGGTMLKVASSDGSLLDSYANNGCGTGMQNDGLPLSAQNNTDSSSAPCNNIWTNPLLSNSGDAIYVVDDRLGLVRYDPNNLAAGPVWNNAFSNTSDSGSQQFLFWPTISNDDSVVYAVAHFQHAGVNANTGKELWVQNNPFDSTLLGDSRYDMQLAKGDESNVFCQGAMRVQATNTATGDIYWRTGQSLNHFRVSRDGKRVYGTSFRPGVVMAFDAVLPTETPTVIPTEMPTASPIVPPPPTLKPTNRPTVFSTADPTFSPSQDPTSAPTTAPTAVPTAVPSVSPTISSSESLFASSNHLYAIQTILAVTATIWMQLSNW